MASLSVMQVDKSASENVLTGLVLDHRWVGCICFSFLDVLQFFSQVELWVYDSAAFKRYAVNFCFQSICTWKWLQRLETNVGRHLCLLGLTSSTLLLHARQFSRRKTTQGILHKVRHTRHSTRVHALLIHMIALTQLACLISFFINCNGQFLKVLRISVHNMLLLSIVKWNKAFRLAQVKWLSLLLVRCHCNSPSHVSSLDS